MANPKMLSIPVLLDKQEVPAFSCLSLIDWCRFHILNFTTLFLIPRNPLPVKTPQIHVNYRQENACISCLASKEGSGDTLPPFKVSCSVGKLKNSIFFQSILFYFFTSFFHFITAYISDFTA